METNNIYVTKKEFYSTVLAILAGVLLIVGFSKEELSWREYSLALLIGTYFIFISYKAVKETSKSKSFSQETNNPTGGSH